MGGTKKAGGETQGRTTDYYFSNYLILHLPSPSSRKVPLRKAFSCTLERTACGLLFCWGFFKVRNQEENSLDIQGSSNKSLSSFLLEEKSLKTTSLQC